MALHDVHAHLTHPLLRDEQNALVERARQAGVGAIISNGLNPTDNQRVLELSRAYPMVKPAFGFYPVDAVLADMLRGGDPYEHRDDPVVETAEGIAWVAAHAAEAIAVGEIGLDGYWVPERYWPAQERAFCELVQIALSADKPIIIHTRKREERAFELLREMGVTRVNWHCFGGKVKLARRILDAGHWMSVPANARRSESFTAIIRSAPRERLLLETDCPYLGPEPGVRNEPANVAKTAAYMASLWEVSEQEMETQLSRNFETLFLPQACSTNSMRTPPVAFG